MAKNKKTLDELLQEAIVKDAPYEVPGNWVWSKLEYVSVIKTGKKDANYGEENGQYDFFTCAAKPINSSTYSFDGEYIILPGNGANVGLVIYYNGRFEAYQRTYVLKFNKLVTKYIYYNLLFLWKDYNNNKQYGSATNYIKLDNIRKYSMPIPPLKEQERIVEKIEGLFEKLDKAKELIEEVRGNFEKRKASILEKAFKGELTEKWREENKYTFKGLKELLLQQNKLIKKSFSYDKAIELYDIPIEWEWVKLKDICEKFKYGTSKKSIKEGKIPVLRMGNLQNGKIDWSDLVYTNDESDILKYELKEGDILFNRTNSPELVGKASIYGGLVQSIYAGYLIRIRVLNSIESKYVNYFMNSIIAKRRCMEVKTDGVSQSNINAEKLGEFDIPICSLEEQKEIVRILDKLLDEESKIEKLTNLQNQIELTKKSILAKAFRGELGNNNPGEESAIELLKEVLQEKL